MLAAAQRILNPPGEGSSPSDPTDNRHWSSSGKDTAPSTAASGGHAATWVRVPPGAPDWFFDNSAHHVGTHDVAAACRLAMAEVRVQLPLGALQNSRTWESLVFRRFREPEIVGSTPAVLTCIAVGPVLVRAGAC